MNVQNNDVSVRFTVRVPAGVTFVGKTVNGEIEATRLNGDVALTTVNGRSPSPRPAAGRASTVNGSIRGEMGRADWIEHARNGDRQRQHHADAAAGSEHRVKASTVNGDISSDFPMTITGRISRRKIEGTIGGGGRLARRSTA